MADNRQISYHILADSTQVVKTSMSYFITEGRLTVGAEALLEGPEAKHALLSRRMRTGELIEIQDQAGQRFSCQIKAVGKTELLCMVIKQVIAPNEYKTHVILCQALIAEQALDFVIQKATELGAYKVCIFQAEHSPRKLQIDKHARWNRIAAEAAKQCGRVRGAEIASEKFETLLLQASKNSGYYFSQEATTKIQQKQAATKPGQELFLFIGPEGGWSEKEINFFGAYQIPALELSPFTLRAETAALAALSQFSLYLK